MSFLADESGKYFLRLENLDIDIPPDAEAIARRPGTPLASATKPRDPPKPGPLLWTHRDYVDFYQSATITSRQHHLHRRACGLVRLLLGAEELRISGHHSSKVPFADFCRIAPEVHTHHYHVGQRQFLRFEELLN